MITSRIEDDDSIIKNSIIQSLRDGLYNRFYENIMVGDVVGNVVMQVKNGELTIFKNHRKYIKLYMECKLSAWLNLYYCNDSFIRILYDEDMFPVRLFDSSTFLSGFRKRPFLFITRYYEYDFSTKHFKILQMIPKHYEPDMIKEIRKLEIDVGGSYVFYIKDGEAYLENGVKAPRDLVSRIRMSTSEYIVRGSHGVFSWFLDFYIKV